MNIQKLYEAIKNRDFINTKKAFNEAMDELTESIGAVYRDDVASGYMAEGEEEIEDEDEDEEEVEEAVETDEDEDENSPLEEFKVRQKGRSVKVNKIAEEDETEEDEEDEDELKENPLIMAGAVAVASKALKESVSRKAFLKLSEVDSTADLGDRDNEEEEEDKDTMPKSNKKSRTDGSLSQKRK